MADTRTARVIPAFEYRRERWRNGAGWTREIAREVDGGDAWTWRLSIAEIEQDAPFSAFPGVDRELVLLSGAGLRLCFDDGEERLLLPPHDRMRFAGERALDGRLVDGRTEDFNVMWRRDRVAAEVLHRPLVGPMVFFAGGAESWALHLVTGHARFDAASGLPPMGTGDTAVLQAEARTRFLVDGGGELFAIRLTRLEPGAVAP